MKRENDEFVDLHVAVVPQRYWKQQLNYANYGVLAEKISAGFIRVRRNSTIYSLRDEISKQIGLDKTYPQYVFLREVAKCLVLVHRKQEDILKSSDFTPPTIEHPELLILPEGLVQRAPSQISTPPPARSFSRNRQSSVNRSPSEPSTADPLTEPSNGYRRNVLKKKPYDIQRQYLPYLPQSRLSKSRQSSTEPANEGELVNGFLQKIEPDGQSSVSPNVQSHTPYISQTSARRHGSQRGELPSSPSIGANSQKAIYPYSSGTADPAVKMSAASLQSSERSTESAVSKRYNPNNSRNDTTTAYLPDLNDRRGSGSSSIREDYKQKGKYSLSSPSKVTESYESDHDEEPHPNVVAHFIKSKINEVTKSPDAHDSSSSRYSDEEVQYRGENYKDTHSDRGPRTHPSGSQYVNEDSSSQTLSTMEHSDVLRSRKSSRLEQVRSALSEERVTFSQHSSKQGEPIAAISNEEETDYGNPVDAVVTTIGRPVIFHKTEQVNAVAYRNRELNSKNSERGHSSSIHGTITGSARSEPTSPRYSATPLDESRRVAIKSENEDAFLGSSLQRGRHPSASTERSVSNNSATILSEERHPQTVDSPVYDKQTHPLKSETLGADLEDHGLRDFNDTQYSQFTRAHHQSYLESHDDKQQARDMERKRVSPFSRESSSGGSPNNSPIYSGYRDVEVSRASAYSRQMNSPPIMEHYHGGVQPANITPHFTSHSRSFGERSKQAMDHLTATDRPISDFYSIPGEQGVSRRRGTPDGTHISKRTGASSERRGDRASSRSHTRPNELKSVASYSYGYANPHESPNMIQQSRKSTDRLSRGDDNETPSSPLHDDRNLPQRETPSANDIRRRESQMQKERVDDPHLRNALWQDLRKARERRERLEEVRQVMIKEARLKAAMISRKRDGSQDVWKRRYHEEKKVTDSLTKFYQALESQCNNVNQKAKTMEPVAMPALNRRRNTMRTTNTGERPSFKKSSELQAKRIISQINEMKNRLAEVKAKLAMEIKVRHDMENELKTMRKGLLSKKIQSNLAFRRINHYEKLAKVPRGIPRRKFRKY